MKAEIQCTVWKKKLRELLIGFCKIQVTQTEAAFQSKVMSKRKPEYSAKMRVTFASASALINVQPLLPFAVCFSLEMRCALFPQKNN